MINCSLKNRNENVCETPGRLEYRHTFISFFLDWIYKTVNSNKLLLRSWWTNKIYRQGKKLMWQCTFSYRCTRRSTQIMLNIWLLSVGIIVKIIIMMRNKKRKKLILYNKITKCFEDQMYLTLYELISLLSDVSTLIGPAL